MTGKIIMQLLKVHKGTKDPLDKQIKKIENRMPYLKGSISYNAIILMLLGKNKIRLSKQRYLLSKKLTLDQYLYKIEGMKKG